MSFDAYKALMLPTLSYFGFKPDNWTIDKSHDKPKQLKPNRFSAGRTNPTNGALGFPKLGIGISLRWLKQWSGIIGIKAQVT